MSEKVGRNDPCPCGSGKKYKQCCLLKDQQKATSFEKRKFTAKVISAGGALAVKPEPQEQSKEKQQAMQAAIDYNTLMERSFGSGIHSNEKPPMPANSSDYLPKNEQ